MNCRSVFIISALLGLFLQPVAFAASVEERLAPILGLAYRADGAVNDSGAYATFAAPDVTFASPGFNCSGFVLQAMRGLSGKAISLEQAKRDRLGDSGPGAELGEDWDFGVDLILNVSEGTRRRWLMPDGRVLAVEDMPGRSEMAGFRGYDLHAPGSLEEICSRLAPGAVCLVDFSRDVKRAGYKLEHYHVGLLYRDAKGTVWLYHATPGRGMSYRQEISTPAGRQAFLKAYANTGNVRKRLLVLELGGLPD